MINEGKLAVVLGMEVSEPFNCSLEAPLNSPDRATEQRDRRTGSTSSTTSACASSRSSTSSTTRSPASPATAASSASSSTAANWLSTGSFWDLDECEDPENHDNVPTHIEEPHNDDLIIGNGLDAVRRSRAAPCRSTAPTPSATSAASPSWASTRSASIMDHQMIFDPDHMSVIARNQALDLVEEEDYPGVVLLAQLVDAERATRGSSARAGS